MSMTLESFNLIEMGMLPYNWQQHIFTVANSFSERVHLSGEHSTSRETTIDGIDVFMVDGSIIQERLEWLYSLYRIDLLNLINFYFNELFECSNSVKTSITLNSLRGRGSRYELHVDSNPMTGLLFATTHPPGCGGELVFNTSDGLKTIFPTAGQFIIFDAREVPHSVMPLLVDDTRISIPMNFYFKNKQQPDWL